MELFIKERPFKQIVDIIYDEVKEEEVVMIDYLERVLTPSIIKL